jgi:beta-catenin-like protein 1
MIRLIRELNFSSRLALKVLNYALTESPYNCRHFIDSLGLKFLFPAFLKKGIKGKNKEEQLSIDGFFL